MSKTSSNLLRATLPLRLRADVAVTARTGTKLRFREHQTVFHAGEPATSIYEVVDGVLIVFKLLSDGRRQIVEIVPQGWVCGFANEIGYDGSCEALTDSTVMAYSRGQIEPHRTLRNRLSQQAEKQLCALHDHALTLGRKDTEERLATFLMRFVPSRSNQFCTGAMRLENDANLQLPLSRAEIADYLGLTIETVSRAITVLAKKNIIKVGRGHGKIWVNNICRLRALARTGRNE